MTLDIRFHPSVYSDVDKVMSYYDKVAGPQLADDFYAEFIAFVQNAAKDPDIFNIRIRDLRRVNLERFPYNFLFRVLGDTIRILVLRHHARRPSFGLRRCSEPLAELSAHVSGYQQGQITLLPDRNQ